MAATSCSGSRIASYCRRSDPRLVENDGTTPTPEGEPSSLWFLVLTGRPAAHVATQRDLSPPQPSGSQPTRDSVRTGIVASGSGFDAKRKPARLSAQRLGTRVVVGHWTNTVRCSYYTFVDIGHTE